MKRYANADHELKVLTVTLNVSQEHSTILLSVYSNTNGTQPNSQTQTIKEHFQRPRCRCATRIPSRFFDYSALRKWGVLPV